jgi:hypothetical protein
MRVTAACGQHNKEEKYSVIVCSQQLGNVNHKHDSEGKIPQRMFRPVCGGILLKTIV